MYVLKPKKKLQICSFKTQIFSYKNRKPKKIYDYVYDSLKLFD